MLIAALDDAGGSVDGPVKTAAFELGASDERMVTLEFAAAEVTNLFHHAAETAWRLFLCLPEKDGVRLALARLSPPALRAALRAYIDEDQDANARQVRELLHVGGASDTATDHVTATGRLLRFAAGHLIDHSPLYNAAKHGFAVSADNSMIGFSETKDVRTPRLSRTGLWLRAVQAVQRDDRECWTVTHTAVDTDRMMALTYLLIGILGTLWNVGQWQSGVTDEVALAMPSGDQMSMLLDRPRMEITRVRFDLPYVGRDRTITMEFEVLAPPGSDWSPPDDDEATAGQT